MLPDAGGDGKPSARGLILSLVCPTVFLSVEHARNDGENDTADEEEEARLGIVVELSGRVDAGKWV